MDRKKQSVNKDKKLKKKEELAKKKAIDETVRTAAAKAAPIEEFPSFLKYERNGNLNKTSKHCFLLCSLHTNFPVSKQSLNFGVCKAMCA
jgi:hypothetical protein